MESEIVEVRTFSWLGAKVDVDAARLARRPLDPSSNFRLRIPTTVLAEDAVVAIARARAGRSSPASLEGVSVSLLELERVEADLALLHHVDDVTGLVRADVAPGETKEWAEGLLFLRVQLEAPLAAAIPHPVHPLREGDVSFENALQVARTSGYPVVLSGVVETERWWYFPWRQIGSIGGIVEKAGGKLTYFGSGPPLEDWIAAFERGLLPAAR